MTHPKLAPRPQAIAVSLAPRAVPLVTHSDVEWATWYHEIKRLYVHERRKLRDVMQRMENEHHFRATEQMYKKRFAKWGFNKYSRRAGVIVRPKPTHNCRIVADRKSALPIDVFTVPKMLKLDLCDGLALALLTSVRTWSIEFFESVRYHQDGTLVSQQQVQRLTAAQPHPAQTKEINFVFKLATDMLDRGHGNLAGRLARKAFLLVEDMLSLEGPALVWNLLEIMYYLLTLHHIQLFHMLLVHLVALADGRIPAAHPLSVMLQGLQELVWGFTGVASTPKRPSRLSLPSYSSSSLLSSSYDAIDKVAIGALPALLQRAWILNAEIVFSHFDPRLFNLYFGILWESCSIAPSPQMIATTRGWFSRIEGQQALPTRIAARRAKHILASTSVEKSRASMQLPRPRADASPPQDYEMLRASSIVVLGKHWEAIIREDSTFCGDGTVVLRMIHGLGLARLLNNSPVVMESSNSATTPDGSVTPFDASNVASMIRAVVELTTESSGDDIAASLNDVERIRAIVALCGYSEGETYPQVVQDMWQLQDALIVAGESAEADEVRNDAFYRIERYVHDIPAGSA